MIKTNLLYLTCLCTGINTALGYQSDSPSSTVKDTSHVINMLQQYEALKYDQQDKAEEYVRRALALSRSIAFEKGEVDSQLALGALLELQSHYDSSLYYFDQAYHKAEEIHYMNGVIKSLIGKGKTFRSISEWNNAIPPLLQSITLLEQGNGDSSLLASSYNHLGNIYSDQHQFEESLEYYQKSIALLNDDDRTKAIATLNIGLIHFRLQNFENALGYYDQAMDCAETASRPSPMGGSARSPFATTSPAGPRIGGRRRSWRAAPSPATRLCPAARCRPHTSQFGPKRHGRCWCVAWPC